MWWTKWIFWSYVGEITRSDTIDSRADRYLFLRIRSSRLWFPPYISPLYSQHVNETNCFYIYRFLLYYVSHTIFTLSPSVTSYSFSTSTPNIRLHVFTYPTVIPHAPWLYPPLNCPQFLTHPQRISSNGPSLTHPQKISLNSPSLAFLSTVASNNIISLLLSSTTCNNNNVVIRDSFEMPSPVVHHVQQQLLLLPWKLRNDIACCSSQSYCILWKLRNEIASHELCRTIFRRSFRMNSPVVHHMNSVIQSSVEASEWFGTLFITSTQSYCRLPSTSIKNNLVFHDSFRNVLDRYLSHQLRLTPFLHLQPLFFEMPSPAVHHINSKSTRMSTLPNWSLPSWEKTRYIEREDYFFR